jgi:hypothetical protein
MSWYVSLSGITFLRWNLLDLKAIGWNVLILSLLLEWHFRRWKFQMKMTWYVSASGITSLGWNILDEKSWCVTFCDYIFGWKCLNVVIHFWMKISWCAHFLGWNILDEWSNVEISWMSWMKCLNLDISWNVLDECPNLDMRRQFLDEIGGSLLLKPMCFRSVGKRAWMSGDCIGTVAVAEKGERWQAHVQRIQKELPHSY